MNQSWPMIALGKILKLQRRWVKVNALADYTEIGIRSFGRGIFHKSPVSGASLGNKRVLQIEPGDLVFMNVFAWEGAVAVAGAKEAGKIGSHRFATYTPIDEAVDHNFLQLYFRTPAGRELLGRVSPGSAGRNRTMNLAAFAQQPIPLPPIEEQRRIVARIEALVAKIIEARSLCDDAVVEVEQLCRSLIFGQIDRCTPTQMGELVSRRPLDVEVRPDETYQFAGVYCFGRGVFRSKRISGNEFSYRQLTKLRTDDFIYPKLMAWEGALATVPQECDGCVVSPEFPVFAPDLNRVLPETLDVYFRTPAIWPALSGASTGTNVRRKRLNPDDFLAYRIPLPSMCVQRQLRAVRRYADEMRRVQMAAAAELGALLSSMLDRAFKGQL